MAVLASTPVPTANGWMQASDLQIGDTVFDHLGQPQTITRTQLYTPQVCYEVQLDDGLTIQGDGKLTLHLQTRQWRNLLDRHLNRKNRQHWRKMTKPLAVLNLEELSTANLKSFDDRTEYSVPNCLPVQYPSRDLPVPPYIFGIYLATLSPTNRHWLRNQPLNKMQRIFRGYGHSIVTRKHKNGDTLFSIRPSVRDSFLFAGLTIPKDLPNFYTDGSVEQRIGLLEGLIDGGAIKKDKKGKTFVMKEANYHYIRKIQSVVESFGVRSLLLTPKRTPSYTLKFRINDDFSVLYGTNKRYVRKIEQIPAQKCVHLEAPNQILVGEGYIPVC